jgi:hypothetical protein
MNKMLKFRKKSSLSIELTLIFIIILLVFIIQFCIGVVMADKSNAYIIFEHNESIEEDELNMTFFFGYVKNITHFEDFIRFNAINLFYASFQPLNYGSFTSEEQIIAKQVFGLTINGQPSIIFGFYKTSLIY